MTKPISSIAALSFFAALAVTGLATAQAKQRCSAAAGHTGYWSWRMIDDRKCWYEGKPMLSKSLLEWPAQRRATPAALDAEPAGELRDKPGKPLDANAWAPDDFDTFETRWRAIGTAH